MFEEGPDKYGQLSIGQALILETGKCWSCNRAFSKFI